MDGWLQINIVIDWRIWWLRAIAVTEWKLLQLSACLFSARRRMMVWQRKKTREIKKGKLGNRTDKSKYNKPQLQVSTSNFPVTCAALENETEFRWVTLCLAGGPPIEEGGPPWIKFGNIDPPPTEPPREGLEFKPVSPMFVKVMLPGDVICVESISIFSSSAMCDSGGSCCRWTSREWRIRSSFWQDSLLFWLA